MTQTHFFPMCLFFNCLPMNCVFLEIVTKLLLICGSVYMHVFMCSYSHIWDYKNSYSITSVRRKLECHIAGVMHVLSIKQGLSLKAEVH